MPFGTIGGIISAYAQNFYRRRIMPREQTEARTWDQLVRDGADRLVQDVERRAAERRAMREAVDEGYRQLAEQTGDYVPVNWEAQTQANAVGEVEARPWGDIHRVPVTPAVESLHVIEAERDKQRTLGYTPEKDARYEEAELACAALAYVDAAQLMIRGGDVPAMGFLYPWDQTSFRPVDAKTALTKAGALILAQLETLILNERRENERETRPPQAAGNTLAGGGGGQFLNGTPWEP